jgi:hypothetical protein
VGNWGLGLRDEEGNLIWVRRESGSSPGRPSMVVVGSVDELTTGGVDKRLGESPKGSSRCLEPESSSGRCWPGRTETGGGRQWEGPR